MATATATENQVAKIATNKLLTPVGVTTTKEMLLPPIGVTYCHHPVTLYISRVTYNRLLQLYAAK